MHRRRVRDVVQLVLARRHNTGVSTGRLQVLGVEEVLCHQRAPFGVELGRADPHVQARASEFLAHRALEAGIFDRRAELVGLRRRRDDETDGKEVGCIVPLRLGPVVKPKVAAGRAGCC